MAHRPEDRYSSCAALAADIEHWLADEPVSAYCDPAMKRITRWGKRHRGVAAASLALAACIFLGLIAGTVILGRKNSEIAAHAAAAVRQGELAEEQRAAASRQLYVSQMNLAQRAWDENNVGRVRELLATQTPNQTGSEDLRGWEWHYLHRLANSERRRIRLEAVCVAISPDGRRHAAGDVTGKVRLWSDDNSDPIDIPAHGDRVNRVLFTPDGARLLTASRDGSIKLWNLNDLSVTQSLPVLNLPVQQAKSCQMMALSRDGARLAVGVDDIAIYSLPDGKPLVRIPSQSTFITSLAFTGDGLHLVTGMWDDTVRVWNAVSGEQEHSITCNAGRIEGVAISSDDKSIYAGGRDGSVSIWNLADGIEKGRSYFHIGKINDLVISPDGSQLASASDDATIRVWNTASGALLKTLRGHESGVNGIAFSPDGERLLTSG